MVRAAQDNAIAELPPAIHNVGGTLLALNVKNNKLTLLCPAVGGLHRLQMLDAGYNLLEALPRQLGLCRNLEILLLNGAAPGCVP